MCPRILSVYKCVLIGVFVYPIWKTVKKTCLDNSYVSNIISEHTAKFIDNPRETISINSARKELKPWQFVSFFFACPYGRIKNNHYTINVIDFSLALLNIVRMPVAIIYSAFQKARVEGYTMASAHDFALKLLIALIVAVAAIVAVATRAIAAIVIGGIETVSSRVSPTLPL